MPIYQFRCPKCEDEVEVYRSMSDAGTPELCSVCLCTMDRVFTPPMVQVPVTSGYFDHGLGRYIHHKSDVQSAISEIRQGHIRRDEITGETSHIEGPELVPIGSEKPKVKRQMKQYPTAAELGF